MRRYKHIKKLTNKAMIALLNENGYHNNHNISEKKMPYISFNAAIRGRGLNRSAYVSLNIKGMKFKNTHWMDNGALCFSYAGKDKTEAITQALARAAKYVPDGDELVSSPFGGFVLKSSLEKAFTEKFSWDKEDLGI